jgi:hypothetical protein
MKKIARMKKFIGVSIFASILLSSCGGTPEEELDKKITLPDPPKDIKYQVVSLVEGPLSEYVEVVPGVYNLELEKNEDPYFLGYSGTIKVKFKFIKSIDVKSGTGYNSFGPSLIGHAIDSKGATLKFEMSVETDEDLATYLKRGSGEEWIILTISSQGTCANLEEANKQLDNYKKGKEIRFNSEIVEEEFDTEEASSEETESLENESADSGDCSEFLDGYEDFMNEYIAIIKKYKNDPTDTDILSDYSSIMSEASEWSTKTSNCAGDAAFAAKFTKIQMKIANAASGL